MSTFRPVALVAHNPVRHWEIGGPNMPALREFYTKAFGWTITDTGPTYSLVQPTDGGLGGGLMQTAEYVVYSYGTLCPR